MTVKQTIAWWTAAVAVVLGVTLGIAMLNDMASRHDEPGLPVPPPGYEYCTNGNTVGFCRQETP